ncbi:hypothetical protein BGY98DRAFT_32227 [Russula aff. rugulosa BPL654]|nr:hypothetical protein BGY98DRAFT_32227 [Russula aff. rugulosa BPL654]
MAGIAVWLVPSEPESALLQQLMSRHPEPSVQHSFPHFHPHVTLTTIRPLHLHLPRDLLRTRTAAYQTNEKEHPIQDMTMTTTMTTTTTQTQS